MSNTDIRQWAREKGIDVNARGPVNKAVVDLYDAENGAELAEGEEIGFEPDFDVPQEPATVGEVAPDMGRKGIRGKLKLNRGESHVRRTGRRTSLEWLGSSGWTIAANVLGAVNLVPAARVMQMQAPVAGLVLDDTLKGTVADRVLQPLAKMGDKAGDAGALFGPIVLVTAIQKRPDLYPVLRPVLVEMMYRWYEVAGPQMKKLETRRAKRVDEMGGIDMDELINAIFAPMPGQEPETDGSEKE